MEGGNQENSTLSPRCSICNVRKFATHKSFCNKSVNNLQKNISKPFKCSICNYEARVKSKLKRHFVGVHKMEFNAIQNTWISRITTALKNQRNKNNLFIEESIQSFNCCICDYVQFFLINHIERIFAQKIIFLSWFNNCYMLHDFFFHFRLKWLKIYGQLSLSKNFIS